MGLLSKKIGIDLGTSRTRITTGRHGIIIDEPSVVAKNTDSGKIVAVGFDALEMIGRTPGTLTVYHPMRRGVIADFGATSIMLRAFIQKAVGTFHLQKPEAMITVSVSATSTEQRAVTDIGLEAGLQQVHLIQSPVAAALGARIPLTEPTGNMIIDMGSGTTEIIVLSLGGVIAKKAIRLGGSDIDDAILSMLRRNHGLSVGRANAEELKIELGCLSRDCPPKKSKTISGRSLLENVPKTVTIHSGDLRSSLEHVIDQIVLTTRQVIEETPPELVSDIKKHGIILSGGASLLNGVDAYLTERLNTQCARTQKPALASLRGTQTALEHLADYKKSLLTA